MQTYNPEIDWETGEVKMTRYLLLCRRNIKLEKGQKVKNGKRAESKERKKSSDVRKRENSKISNK